MSPLDRVHRLSSTAIDWLRLPTWRAGLNLLLPPQCVNCRADMHGPADQILLCPSCREQLAPPQSLACRQCGATVPYETGEPGCPRCHGRRWHFDAVFPLGMYRDELRRAVLRMKRVSEESLSMAIGQLLAERTTARLAEMPPEAIVPVPMHWTRRLIRGTNNPELLAAQLAGPLHARVITKLLVRRRRTLPHGSLSRRKRFRNIHGALAVRPGYRLDGARIVLVDDILTTGVTCNEAARVLKAAGAKSVFVAVVARRRTRVIA